MDPEIIQEKVQPSTNSRIGVAIIGLGRIGSIHLEDLRQCSRVSVRYLVEADLAKAVTLAQQFECPPKCVHPSQLDDVLRDTSVEGVFICSPSSFHHQQIKASLNAGKAVFCEKPLTTSVETTEQCYQLAQEKRLPLFCAFHRRFDPSISKVKESIDNIRTSGPLRMLKFSSHDPSPPPILYIKSSGGIINDSTIHDLDLALWMSGSPATSVYVQGQAFDPEVGACGDNDLVLVVITHESGAMSVIDNGRRCAFGYDQRIEAQCQNASYFVSNRSTHLMTELSSADQWSNSNTPPIDQSFITRYANAYANEVNHFLDVMQGKATLGVTQSDIMATMRLVEAAKESNRTGNRIKLGYLKTK